MKKPTMAGKPRKTTAAVGKYTTAKDLQRASAARKVAPKPAPAAPIELNPFKLFAQAATKQSQKVQRESTSSPEYKKQMEASRAKEQAKIDARRAGKGGGQLPYIRYKTPQVRLPGGGAKKEAVSIARDKLKKKP
jgi:hypothetical protein